MRASRVRFLRARRRLVRELTGPKSSDHDRMTVLNTHRVSRMKEIVSEVTESFDAGSSRLTGLGVWHITGNAWYAITNRWMIRREW